MIVFLLVIMASCAMECNDDHGDDEGCLCIVVAIEKLRSKVNTF